MNEVKQLLEMFKGWYKSKMRKLISKFLGMDFAIVYAVLEGNSQRILALEEKVSDVKAQNNRLFKQVHSQKQTIAELTKMGVDIHFKEPHLIFIVSTVGGGSIRHIPTKIDTMQDLRNMVHDLKERYGMFDKNVILDGHPEAKRFIHHHSV